MSRGLRFTEAELQGLRASCAGGAPARKPSKYRNTKTLSEHGQFDSAKEARRFDELVLLERAGAIANLCRQVPFALVVNGVHVCSYIADAVYRESARVVVEDTKSPATRVKPEYRIKLKLMQACYGIQVVER